MLRDQLGKATTLELLIELMYAGKSQIVPELQALEPISIEEIAAVLELRHNERFGTNFGSWYDWFQSSSSPGSQDDQATLLRLKDFKEKSDPLFKRARERLD